MPEEPDNLVIRLLQQMHEKQNRLEIKMDRIIDDVQDLKVRMTNVEENLAGVNRRLDRLELRVDRIERRLDLIEPAHGK
jgi:predicted  nucleic acid-binding Zn-ribbon protein